MREAAEYTGRLTLALVLLMIIAFAENKTLPFYIKDVYLPTWSTLRIKLIELESTRVEFRDWNLEFRDFFCLRPD